MRCRMSFNVVVGVVYGGKYFDVGLCIKWVDWVINFWYFIRIKLN